METKLKVITWTLLGENPDLCLGKLFVYHGIFGQREASVCERLFSDFSNDLDTVYPL